jgi:SAM-dependent methyltransferase
MASPGENMDVLRLDLGCGKQKRPGFIGVDVRPFDSVDVVCDLSKDRWPWEDGSVSEISSSHFIEHLDAEGRIHFVNEAFRVLVPGGMAYLIAPAWKSSRAYGDLTHKWPPVCEWWPLYLNKSWRDANAPHNDFYTCDFDVNSGPALDPHTQLRNPEYQQFAARYYTEASMDLHITLKKRA